MATVYASAKIIRAMRSRFRPHEGTKQQMKAHVSLWNISQYTESRQRALDKYVVEEKEAA